MPLLPAQFKCGAELGVPGDEYNKSPYREGRPKFLKDKTQLPSLRGNLLYSSTGAPSSAPYFNCAGSEGTALAAILVG